MINFTVQKSNYHEVADFANWVSSYDQINSIYFALVDRWGHISSDKFDSDFMLDEYEKRELSELLKDPIFSNKKIMLGNLNSIKDSNEKV